jgi:hypothetical protein
MYLLDLRFSVYENEEFGLLGYNALKYGGSLAFWRKILLPSSGSKNKPCKNPA